MARWRPMAPAFPCPFSDHPQGWFASRQAKAALASRHMVW
jgi:hypothetical protein